MKHSTKVRIFAIITLSGFIISTLATGIFILLEGNSNQTQETVQTSTGISLNSNQTSTNSGNSLDFSIEEISSGSTNN